MKLSGKAVLYMALVFASGAVLGVVGERSYNTYKTVSVTKNKSKERRPPPTPDDYRRRYISFMQRRLNLSEEQATQLGIILDETRAKFNELQSRIVPEQAAIGKGQTDKIRAMLDEDQRAEYEVLLKEREARNKNKRKGGKGGRPPGGPGGPGF